MIELLAVIVVITIIALIAVPMILNIIEKARKGSVVASARNYIKAVETYIVSSELDKDKLKLDKNNKYNVTKSTVINEKNYLKINDLVEIKGSIPIGSEDYIILNETKKVIEAKLTINGYEILIKNDEVVSVVKGKKIRVESITLNKLKETMERGSSFKLEPIFNPSNTSDKRVTYASSNEDIVTVNDEGIVTAKEVGNAKIIVTSIDDTRKKAECNIEVVVSATGLKIEPAEKEIFIGETVTLVGTIEPSNATTSSLTWTTSDINIASVDENGVVTGISKGETIITAETANGISSTSKITVNEISPNSITLDKTNASIEIGKTLQLNATVLPNNTTNKTVTWTSSNTGVATVSSSGLVTGKATGSSIITAKTNNGKSVTASITVYKIELLSNKVNVGDYVAYNVIPAGKGWRVLSVSGNTVTIVHAGAPENCTNGVVSSSNVWVLNNEAQKYKDDTYADSAHAMNYNEALAITGSTEETTNTLRNIGSEYWLATPLSGSFMNYVAYYGSISYTENTNSYGMRPVVVLKPNVKAAGKVKDAVGNDAWSLVAS